MASAKLRWLIRELLFIKRPGESTRRESSSSSANQPTLLQLFLGAACEPLVVGTLAAANFAACSLSGPSTILSTILASCGGAVVVKHVDWFETVPVKMIVPAIVLVISLILGAGSLFHLDFSRWEEPYFLQGGSYAMFQSAAVLTFVFIRPAQIICSKSSFIYESAKRPIIVANLFASIATLLAVTNAVAMTTLISQTEVSYDNKHNTMCLMAHYFLSKVYWIPYSIAPCAFCALIIISYRLFKESVHQFEKLAINNLFPTVFAKQLCQPGVAVIPVVIVSVLSMVANLFVDGFTHTELIGLTVLVSACICTTAALLLHYKPAVNDESNVRGVVNNGQTIDEESEIRADTSIEYGTNSDTEIIGNSDCSDNEEENIDAAVQKYRIRSAANRLSALQSHQASRESYKCSTRIILVVVLVVLPLLSLCCVQFLDLVRNGNKLVIGLIVAGSLSLALATVILICKPRDEVTSSTLLVRLPMAPLSHIAILALVQALAHCMPLSCWISVFAWLSVGFIVYIATKLLKTPLSFNYNQFNSTTAVHVAGNHQRTEEVFLDDSHVTFNLTGSNANEPARSALVL